MNLGALRKEGRAPKSLRPLRPEPKPMRLLLRSRSHYRLSNPARDRQRRDLHQGHLEFDSSFFSTFSKTNCSFSTFSKNEGSFSQLLCHRPVPISTGCLPLTCATLVNGKLL